MERDLKVQIIKYKSLIGLVLLCAIISIIAPRFLLLGNIINVFTQVSVNAVIAIGMTFVILTGGIDLSVGSTVAIAGAVAAAIVQSGGSVFIALIAALAIGAGIGLFNGLVISKFKLQAFIATLSTMTIFRGVTYVFTNGNPISGLGPNFTFIGNEDVFGIPFPVLILAIVFAIAWYIINQTRFGRYLYALGGNEDSTRLSGINTDKVKTIVFIISGITAALSGIIVTSRIGSASPNAGAGYELDAIAAVVLGGTSTAGGEGSIGGTIIGAMIIGILSNGLDIMNVSPFYQLIVKGSVILIAVILDRKNDK